MFGPNQIRLMSHYVQSDHNAKEGKGADEIWCCVGSEDPGFLAKNVEHAHSRESIGQDNNIIEPGRDIRLINGKDGVNLMIDPLMYRAKIINSEE